MARITCHDENCAITYHLSQKSMEKAHRRLQGNTHRSPVGSSDSVLSDFNTTAQHDDTLKVRKTSKRSESEVENYAFAIIDNIANINDDTKDIPTTHGYDIDLGTYSDNGYRRSFVEKPSLTITVPVQFYLEMFPDATKEDFAVARYYNYTLTSDDFYDDTYEDYYDAQFHGFKLEYSSKRKVGIMSDYIANEESEMEYEFIPDNIKEQYDAEWDSYMENNDVPDNRYINSVLLDHPDAIETVEKIMNTKEEYNADSWECLVSDDGEDAEFFITEPVAFHKELFPDLNEDTWVKMRLSNAVLSDSSFNAVYSKDYDFDGFELNSDNAAESSLEHIAYLLDSNMDIVRGMERKEWESLPEAEQARKEWRQYQQ